jgi:hypothetical protein
MICSKCGAAFTPTIGKLLERCTRCGQVLAGGGIRNPHGDADKRTDPLEVDARREEREKKNPDLRLRRGRQGRPENE